MPKVWPVVRMPVLMPYAFVPAAELTSSPRTMFEMPELSMTRMICAMAVLVALAPLGLFVTTMRLPTCVVLALVGSKVYCSWIPAMAKVEPL
ncbi:MAG: hypothetical protein Q7R41_08620 [Phycisphaerales bacterium]|nr:hypothetical protein [Phycisphaerales bacterium]